MTAEDNTVLNDLRHALRQEPEPSQEELAELQARYPAHLPADYIAFLTQHNGGEAAVGRNYLCLWSIHDVLTVTAMHSPDAPFYHQFIFVASSGYFKYGVKEHTFYELDMLDDSYCVALGSSFSDFLQQFSQHEA